MASNYWTRGIGAVAAMLVVALFLVSPSSGRSQDEEELTQPPTSLGGRGNLNRFTGYTRPGYPPDEIKSDGAIVPVDFGKIEDAMGATVYFTVLDRSRFASGEKRTGAADDTWNTGFENFDKVFKGGVDVLGEASPALDTSARYLYLYQTVNDRQTKMPIRSTSVKLLVDPRYITSWGYFSGVSFGYLNRPSAASSEGGIIPAADKGDDEVILPVSTENRVPDKATGRVKYLYRDPAPPVRGGFTLSLIRGLTRGEVDAGKGAIGPVGFGNLLDKALDPLREPESVAIVGGWDIPMKEFQRTDDGWLPESSVSATGQRTARPRSGIRAVSSGEGFDAVPATDGGSGETRRGTTSGRRSAMDAALRRSLVVRAMWSGPEYLAKGHRSAVFGFTSNLPPTFAPVQLRAPRDFRAQAQPAAMIGGGKLLASARLQGGSGEEAPKANTPSKAPGTGTAPGTGVLPAAGPGTGSGSGTGTAPSGVGTVPTPTPAGIVPAAAEAGPGGFAGAPATGGLGSGLGTALGGGGGLTGGGGAPAGGGFGGGGFAAPPAGGAGGGGAGFGGGGGGNQQQRPGNQTGGQQEGQGQQQGQQQTTGQTISQIVNVSVENNSSSNSSSTSNSSANASAKASAKAKAVAKSSSNSSSEIIPEPSAILLAAMGLPVLWYLWRRRQLQARPAPAA
jgi:hypothetical protein